MLKYILLVGGFFLLIKGADLFVDGSSAAAKMLKVSPLIIGMPIEEAQEIPMMDNYFADDWKEIIRQLDEKYRIVIELYYVEEIPTREIAKMLEISDDNVRSRLSRGRKQLEKIVTESFMEDTHEY